MQIEPGNTTTQHPIKKTSPVNVSKILRIFQLCIDFNAHSSFYQCQKFIFTWFALLLLLRYPIGNYRFKILPQIMSSVHLFKKGKTSISSVNCPLFEIEALANCWQRMSAFLLKTSKKLSRIWKWNAGVKSRRFFLHLSPVKFDVKDIRLRICHGTLYWGVIILTYNTGSQQEPSTEPRSENVVRRTFFDEGLTCQNFLSRYIQMIWLTCNKPISW